MDRIEAEPGESIVNLANRAIAKAKHRNTGVWAYHNDIKVTVNPDSCLLDILTIFDLTRAVVRLEAGYRR